MGLDSGTVRVYHIDRTGLRRSLMLKMGCEGAPSRAGTMGASGAPASRNFRCVRWVVPVGSGRAEMTTKPPQEYRQLTRPC